MERKSIGQFISVLRKANGMTQKDLAEKLNVSDKSVSRWECDECAPDIYLLPVIAELFDVTVDELIRGERITVDQPRSDYQEKKDRLVIESIKNSMKMKIWIQMLISLGIALLGICVAAIINFGFYREDLAFGIALIFLIGATITETVFILLNHGKLSILENEKTDTSDIKKRSWLSALIFYSAIAVLSALAAPLVYRYWAINFIDDWAVPSVYIPVLNVLLIVTVISLVIWYVKYGKNDPKSKSLFKSLFITALILAVAIALPTGVFSLIKKSDYEAREKELCENHTFATVQELSEALQCDCAELEQLICDQYRYGSVRFSSPLLEKYRFAWIEIDQKTVYIEIGRNAGDSEYFIQTIDIEDLESVSNKEIIECITDFIALTEEERLIYDRFDLKTYDEWCALTIAVECVIAAAIFIFKRITEKRKK